MLATVESFCITVYGENNNIAGVDFKMTRISITVFLFRYDDINFNKFTYTYIWISKNEIPQIWGDRL